jgi:hypothetical protein
VRIGFGEASGTVLPARPAASEEPFV